MNGVAARVPWGTSIKVMMALGNNGGEGEQPVGYRWAFTCWQGSFWRQWYTPIENTTVPGHSGHAFIATRYVYGTVAVPPGCANYPQGNPLNPEVWAYMRQVVNGVPQAWQASTTYVWTVDPATAPGASVPDDTGDGVTFYRWATDDEIEYVDGGVRLRSLQGRAAEFVLAACDVVNDVADLFDGRTLVKGVIHGAFDPYYTVALPDGRNGIFYLPVEMINTALDVAVLEWPLSACPA